MSTCNEPLENNESTDICRHFMLKVDQLMNAFNQCKLTFRGFREEGGNISQPFSISQKSRLKLLDEIRVLPPSGNLLYPELTLVCNCLLIDIAEKSQLGAKSGFVSTQFDYLVSKTLTRVLLFALKTYAVLYNPHKKDVDIETLMKEILEIVEDPIARFRLLHCLGRIVLLCSLCCIYKRQRDGPESTVKLLVVLDQLMMVVDQSVLQEVIPYKQGLILCKPENTEDIIGESNLYVEDVARLVMLSFHMVSEEGTVQYKQWQWLFTFLHCKTLIEEKKYAAAMKKLKDTLSQPLDPEQKSILLCQFAECYLLQGCPQLSIQTYKDALQVYRGHHSVFLHLANVYNLLGMHEWELESLNLLVKVLNDKCKKNETQILTTEIDAIIVSVFQVIPNVTLPLALHRLAKCCIKLCRYKDAASHYLQLLRLLENIESITAVTATDGSFLNTDVREIVVEAAESLALAQQNHECISLCDEFYPILSTQDSPSHFSQESSPDVSINVTKTIFDINDSQHSLCGMSPGSESPEVMVASSAEHQASSSTNLRHNDKFETKDNKNVSVTSRCLSNLSNLSRKRMRSASDGQCTYPDLNEKDVWWSTSLPIRLLLSKTDALVTTKGFTDETLSCLTKAFSLFTDSKISIFELDHNTLDTSNQPPTKKCKLAISVDIKQSEIPTTEMSKSEERLEGSSEFPVSKTWKKLLPNLALRMAKASLQRLQMSSVLNSCDLILQMEPHNIFAHYFKTIVLQDRKDQKDRASRHWLQERGITCNSSETALQLVMEEKQKNIRKMKEKDTIESKEWWQTSELELLNMDVTCLNNIKSDQT